MTERRRPEGRRRLRWTLLILICASSSSAADPEESPGTLPNAEPGECYAEVMTPPRFETRTKTVVVREASERVEIVPAEYELVEENVLISEASTRLVPVPAVYEKVEEVIEVRPARVVWLSGSQEGALPVNPTILRAAIEGGVQLDTAPAGQCYHEHFQPARYEVEIERIQLSEASEEVSVIPARYEVTTEKLLVKPASKKLVEVPTVYETVEEKVLVEPAKSVWKPGRGLIERVDHATGDIMCLVEVPPIYETLEKQVVKTPATTKTVEIPAVYEDLRVRKLVAEAQEIRTKIPARFKEISRQVKLSDDQYIWHAVQTPGKFGPRTGNVICKQELPARTEKIVKRTIQTPAGFEKIDVPAKYTRRKVRRLVSPATVTRVPVPEETKTMTERIKVADARLEWKQVLCDTNVSPETIASVQRALASAGFDPGPIDGLLGRRTLRAVHAYQLEMGLSSGGLTLDTLVSLGVDR